MFEIKNGIPVAERTGGRNGGRPAIYKFADMEVEDYFEAPDDMGVSKRGTSRRQTSIVTSGIGYAKRHNPTAKFITRKVGDVIRCWRIA